MRAMLLFFAALIAVATAADAAPLRVVCTLPVLQSIASEVGGDDVEATSLAKGDQDPHFVSPTPVLMKKTREADAFIEIGLSLELWADEVVNGSGNPRIARGQPGRIVASAGIPVLEIPSVLSREMGDIHPEGNPHVWLDPLRAKLVAANVSRGFAALRPNAAERFQKNLERFQRRIDEALFGKALVDLAGGEKLTRLAFDGQLERYLDETSEGGKPLRASLGGWLAKARSLRGEAALEYHKVWAYFARIFGIVLVGEIEERPGIPPGPQHQRATIELIRARKIPLVLVDNFYDPKLPQHIAEEGGAKVVLLPNQVRGEPGIDDYFELIDHILTETLQALNAN